MTWLIDCLIFLAEFGDYDPIEQGYTYLDDYQLGPQEVTIFRSGSKNASN